MDVQMLAILVWRESIVRFMRSVKCARFSLSNGYLFLVFATQPRVGKARGLVLESNFLPAPVFYLIILYPERKLWTIWCALSKGRPVMCVYSSKGLEMGKEIKGGKKKEKTSAKKMAKQI